MSGLLRHMLVEAANTGEVIRIIYHGGSQPGTVREIGPISVSASEVRAHDLASGIAKTFKLAKIELADLTAKAPEYDPAAAPQVEDACAIKQAFAGKIPDLEALGWHIQLSDDAVSVHRSFKNGKPRKIPDVRLSYDEFNVDLVYDLDAEGMVEEKRKSSRPYRVESRNFGSARSFGRLSKASELFLDEARSLAPTNTT